MSQHQQQTVGEVAVPDASGDDGPRDCPGCGESMTAETPQRRRCCPDCGTVAPEDEKPQGPPVSQTHGLRYSAQGGGGT